MILAGDIGGTNTRLALFDEKLSKLHEQTFRNEGRGGVVEIVWDFLNSVEGEQIDRATFGVAGPVKQGTATMTNLPWRLDERELARELDIRKVALINDLVAHGEGIELLRPEQLIVVQEGESTGGGRGGNRAVIAAGTGLGEGGIFWDAAAPPGGGRGQGEQAEQGGRYRAFASEGGHCDFAPRDDRQIALLKFLRGKYFNASWERVLSGPGLRNIYDFLITPEQLGPAAAMAEAEWGGGQGGSGGQGGGGQGGGDVNAVQGGQLAPAPAPAPGQARQGGLTGPRPSKISEAGMKGTNAAAVEALKMFVAFYGAEAANLALKVMATGGIYISGGIALNIVEKLQSRTFLDAFLATGPQNIRQVLAKIPVKIVNFEHNGLYGAANFARHL